MRKVILSLALLISSLFVLPSTAFAETMQNTAQSTRAFFHAFQPFVHRGVDSMGMANIRARINNATTQHQHRLVCVEAMNTASKASTHLGCVDVHVHPMWSDMMWGYEFDTPLARLSSGSYQIMYMYRDDSGKWQKVMSWDNKSWDGVYTAP